MAYLDAAGWVQRGDNGQSIVALGGGHGLSATLRALRHITRQLTAVVTVADDGGSSGRLRKEMPILPPGDLRYSAGIGISWFAPIGADIKLSLGYPLKRKPGDDTQRVQFQLGTSF